MSKYDEYIIEVNSIKEVLSNGKIRIKLNGVSVQKAVAEAKKEAKIAESGVFLLRSYDELNKLYSGYLTPDEIGFYEEK